MPKRRLVRHIDLENSRIYLPLEREYWQEVDIRAYEDGWNNWREFL